MAAEWVVIKSWAPRQDGARRWRSEWHVFEDETDASCLYDELLARISDEVSTDCQWLDLTLELRDFAKKPGTPEIKDNLAYSPTRHHRTYRDEDGKVLVKDLSNGVASSP